MTATRQHISPEQASVILEKNTNNRIASRATILRYADTMQRGEWKLSNDIICISPDGVLMNGQHRLKAVVESATAQDFWVWENCPQEALLTMDLGRKRNATDTATLSSGSKINPTQGKALMLITTDFRATKIVQATPNQMILWWEKYGNEILAAGKLIPTTHKKHAIYLGAATEAFIWSPSAADKIADFFRIALELTPASDRLLDTQGADFIPATIYKWIGGLHKNNQRLRSFQQYKLILKALQDYMNGTSWGSSSRLRVDGFIPELPLFNRS